MVSAMKRLKIGMIGCGGIAKVHVERLKTLAEGRLVAFADIAEERAKAFSKENGGETYTDWREMLDKEMLDIVYICLPPFAHQDEVMVAAEKGIHVFIEKPIALNMELARKMVRAVEKSDVKSQVGYCNRFACGIEEAKRLIHNGEAGEVGLALGWYWCHFVGGEWWRDKNRSGGQIVEQSTHLFDVLRHLCGEVETAYGQMNTRFWKDVPDLTIEDVSSSTFRFSSGAVGGIVATTWGVPNQWWFRLLIAARDYTLFSENPSTLTIYTTKAPVKTKTISEERDTFVLEARDLVQAVLKDKDTRTPIQEGAKTLEFTLATRKSMETGKPVRLPLD